MALERRFDRLEPEHGTLLLSQEMRDNLQALGRANELRPILGIAVDPFKTQALYVELGQYANDGQQTKTFVGGFTTNFAALANPTFKRIDAVVITFGGALSVYQGAEAPAPSAPSYPADSIPIAEVTLPAGWGTMTTSLGTTATFDDLTGQYETDTGVLIKDVRPVYITSAAGFGINPVEEVMTVGNLTWDAGDNQTFNLTAFTYSPGDSEINVFVEGVRQNVGDDYVENSNTELFFNSPLPVNAKIVVWKVGAASAHELADLDDVDVPTAEAVTDPDTNRTYAANRNNPFATLTDVNNVVGTIPFGAEHNSTTGVHGPKVTITQTNDDNALVVTRSHTGSTGAVVVVTNDGAVPSLNVTQNGDEVGVNILQTGVGHAVQITQNDTTVASAGISIQRPVTASYEPFLNLHDNTNAVGANIDFVNGVFALADESTNTRRLTFDVGTAALTLQNGGNNTHLTVNKTGVGGGRSIQVSHAGTAEAVNISNSSSGAALRINNTAGSGSDIEIVNAPNGGVLDPLWGGPASDADLFHTHGSIPTNIQDLANVDINMAAGYTNANSPSAANPLATIADIDASVAKIKFGMYSGNGTTQSINVGFQPDWVMLYNGVDNTQSGVYVARTGDGRFFKSAGTADVAITATGFDLNNGTAPLNKSAENYFYIAIQGNN